MNFFLLHYKHKKNARLHCNKHVVKMILELCQLLYACAHVGGAPLESMDVKPYKLTHKWHPTSIWVRQCKENWMYTIKFAVALCKEYTRRYNKHHSCEKHLAALFELGYYWPLEKRPIKNVCGRIRGTNCTPFPLAMPEDCIVYKDKKAKKVSVKKSYRKYYKKKNEEWTAKGRGMKFTTKFCNV